MTIYIKDYSSLRKRLERAIRKVNWEITKAETKYNDAVETYNYWKNLPFFLKLFEKEPYDPPYPFNVSNLKNELFLLQRLLNILDDKDVKTTEIDYVTFDLLLNYERK